MAQDNATFGAPGGKPTPTPEAAPPITADFMSSIMARLAHQDEVQKTTNDQLAALVAALTAPDGQTSRPQQIGRRLFNTNPTATGGDHTTSLRDLDVLSRDRRDINQWLLLWLLGNFERGNELRSRLRSDQIYVRSIRIKRRSKPVLDETRRKNQRKKSEVAIR
ncbi:hypothetical protein F2Q70_00043833 [Brassica cretica]|uniref:Uncharacterized protein n=1 Tax=Brassica cretica TaxID=69181 RepID=A0A8S9KJA9_BRACR|nr:hypothetical protein F2Q70_00043833 [Brassica cretica]